MAKVMKPENVMVMTHTSRLYELRGVLEEAKNAVAQQEAEVKKARERARAAADKRNGRA